MVMMRDDIIRELKRFRWDKAYRKKYRIPLKPLAAYAGMHRQALYDIMNKRRRIGPGSLQKLSGVIEAILAGKLRFERKHQTWHPVTDTFDDKAPAPTEDPNAKPHLGVLKPQLQRHFSQLR
jgi:transcriptional regulator with XRE-family HTH domain